jgi:DNA-binding response OmpR family regulator
MGKTHTILIVEDESAIREVVRKYLERAGYAVLEADTGLKALESLGSAKVDLIVLDIMLPGLDGLSITRALRDAPSFTPLALNTATPIIVLTARGEESDRIAGFELGADDYVVKPFSPRELVARVKAVLRRGQTSPPAEQDELLHCGALTIDLGRRLATVDGQPITLTAKEFDLLWLFARNPGRVFNREQLLDQVWGYEFYGDASTVTVHIRRLREKVEPDPANPTYIHTVWGVGYKFELL